MIVTLSVFNCAQFLKETMIIKPPYYLYSDSASSKKGFDIEKVWSWTGYTCGNFFIV